MANGSADDLKHDDALKENDSNWKHHHNVLKWKIQRNICTYPYDKNVKLHRITFFLPIEMTSSLLSWNKLDFLRLVAIPFIPYKFVMRYEWWCSVLKEEEMIIVITYFSLWFLIAYYETRNDDLYYIGIHTSRYG